MTIVREVESTDLKAIIALVKSVGWGPPSRESIQRLFVENPALAHAPRTAQGWVLEVEGRVVGYLSNLLQQYRWGDRDLIAAVASSLVVAPEHRGHSLRLVAAFCKQQQLDLLITTTAAIQTSQIFSFLKFARMPQPEYDVSLYWPIRARPFLAAALRKKGYAARLGRIGGTLLAPALGVFLRVSGRRISSVTGDCRIDIRHVSEIGEALDDLWRRKQAEGRRLMAYRDARTLQWHFSAPGRRVVCAWRGTQLAGYLALVRHDTPHLGLKRARVGDLLAENDNPQVIRQLLAAAARQAARDGSAMLEVVGLPAGVRQVLAEFRPFTLRDPSWPFMYRALDAKLHQELLDGDAWYAGLYDGDGSL